ncbi:MAG: hypothetical protein ACYC5O_13985 [Anaerolineae bacterium]
MPSSLVQLTTKHGEVVESSGYRVTPMTRSLLVRVPVPAVLGFSWTWPSAVSVQRPDGSSETLPIRDPTRLAQLGMLGLAVLVGIVAATIGRHRG